MERRELLRTTECLLLTGVGTSLAGCSDDESGGNGNESDGDDNGGSGSESDGDGGSGPGESMGSVAENQIAEFDIVDWESSVNADEDQFIVTLTVENTGNETIDWLEYSFDFIPYDPDGNELEIGSSFAAPKDQFGSDGTGPGETITLELSKVILNASPEAVASYEIIINCSGTFDEGVYCPQG